MIDEEDIRLEWNNDRYYVQIGEEIGKEINSEITILSPLPKSDAIKKRNEILENQSFHEQHKDLIKDIELRNKLVVDPRKYHEMERIVERLNERMRIIVEEKDDFSEESQRINGFVLDHLQSIKGDKE